MRPRTPVRTRRSRLPRRPLPRAGSLRRTVSTGNRDDDRRRVRQRDHRKPDRHDVDNRRQVREHPRLQRDDKLRRPRQPDTGSRSPGRSSPGALGCTRPRTRPMTVRSWRSPQTAAVAAAGSSGRAGHRPAHVPASPCRLTGQQITAVSHDSQTAGTLGTSSRSARREPQARHLRQRATRQRRPARNKSCLSVRREHEREYRPPQRGTAFISPAGSTSFGSTTERLARPRSRR